MIHKKPAVLLSCYNAFGCLNAPSSCQSCTSSTRLSQHPGSKPQSHRRWRTYATVASEPPRNESKRPVSEHEEAHWPRTEPSRLPTPYQILNCRPGATYSKHHFYRLVKLYHPDRYVNEHLQTTSSTVHALPQHVRLERYRLIVAAHTILSDPSKRRLYDQFGSGWAGRPDLSSLRYGGSSSTPEPRQWPPGQNPMYNATWEDWERWYQAQREHEEGSSDQHSSSSSSSPQQHRGLLMNNYAFVSLIVMLAALGGVGQATRASSFSTAFREQKEAANERTHADLMGVRAHAAASGSSREAKVERFLKQRDGAAWADEGTRRMLLEPDICQSERLGEGRGRYKATTTAAAASRGVD
jgi:curved DNA-binding protein CbpA